MSRPRPTPIFHFTRVEHLPAIIKFGLMSDARAQVEDVLDIEVGNRAIKDRRRMRQIPIDPGGNVSDYAPFYFAPRSPMMSSIDHGNVPEYIDGSDRLIYLVTTLQRVCSAAPDVLITDRNAVMEFAEFRRFTGDLDEDFVDWELMKAKFWNNTQEFPDRRERRMAECLVRDVVP